MGGTSKSSQQTQQQSQTGPWAPSQGLLTNILGSIQGQANNYQPTSAETNALNTIQGNYASAPNYGTQATNLANTLLGNTTQPATDALTSGYNQSTAALSPYLNPNYLDPTKSPGMQGVLDTIRNDVSNSVNGMFAGAGRDLSGLNQQTLARGIAQGEAQPLLNQYNQNVAAQQGAIGQLQGGSNAYAQALQGLTQQGLANQAQGIQAGTSIPDVLNNNAAGALNAAGMARQLPLQNLGMLENLTVPIAGLGTQSSGTSNTTGSYTMSPVQQFAGIAQGLGGLFGAPSGGTSAFSNIASGIGGGLRGLGGIFGL